MAYGVPPDELAGRLTAAEALELAAFSELEPWGEGRMDLRFGMLASIICNMFRDKNKPPLTPADFCPDFAGDRGRGRGADLGEMSPDEVRAAAAGMAEALGAQFGGGEGGEEGEAGAAPPGATIAG
jgi:hypothetical protein